MPVAAPTPHDTGGRTLERAACMLAAVVAGLVVYRGALDYFFSQDDFLGLAQAAGLAPRLMQPWRYIANQAIWDLMRPFGTASAWPYHLSSLLAHAACVALLYALLARRLAPWAAMVGVAFFAVHPALFTTLYWISTVGDPLALGFGLLALWIQQRTDRLRWLAVPCFVLSLLSKESLVLLPAVVVVYRSWVMGRSDRAARRAQVAAPGRIIDATAITLAAVAIVYVVYFVTLAYGAYFVSAAGAARDPVAAARAPYALGWGANLWQNLLTYLGWSVVFALPLVHGFSDAVDPAVYPWAIGGLAVWLAGLAARGLRERGWLLGGVMWLAFIVPALPLRNHTYHYYLYASLAGAAWCVAALAEWALARIPRAAFAVACLGTLLLAANGALLVRKIETMPWVLPDLRADPIVDRARIAWNVYESLASAGLPRGVTLLFWSPTAAGLGPRGVPLAGPAPGETYWERNVRNALVGGLAVRVLFPQVAEVRFVREYQPAPPDHRYAVYRPEGRVRIFTSAEVDSILRGMGR